MAEADASKAVGLEEVPVQIKPELDRQQSRKQAKLTAKQEHNERVQASRKQQRANQLVKLSAIEENEKQGATDTILNSLGVPMRIERFPYFPNKGHHPSDYRTPLAVRLLLQFQIEAAGAHCQPP